MLTLTIDPKLFPTASAALEYLQKNRCVARLVRALRKISAAGLLDETGRPLAVLHSDRFFCSLEFQQNGAPHYHLLLDASRVDFDAACVEWGRLRPRSATVLDVQALTAAALRAEQTARQSAGRSRVLSTSERLRIERKTFRGLRLASRAGGPALAPAFGHIRFSKEAARLNGYRGAKKSKRAARYVTKYLTKTPDGGFPEWVLTRHRLRRYSTSRGFWDTAALAEKKPRPARRTAADVPPGVDPDCPICSTCGEYRDGSCACPRPTIGDRMKTCGSTTSILEIKPVFDPKTTRTADRVRYLAGVPMPLNAVLDDIAADERPPDLLKWNVPPAAIPALWAKIRGDQYNAGRLAELDAMLAEMNAAGAAAAAAELLDVFFVFG
jgi:hypothetical protein